jgi:hypothetical protein
VYFCDEEGSVGLFYYHKVICNEMPMIRLTGIILFCCTLALSAYGQHTDSNNLLDKINELCNESPNWSYNALDSKIVLTYSGHFTTNTIFGPRAVTKKELKKPKANSVSFEFVTADGWNDSTYKQIRENNTQFIQTLKEQFINHYDSVGWPPKLSQSVFESNPMKHLKYFNLKSESVYSSIVRLPDFRIGEQGVWMSSSLDFTTWYIVQATVREDIQSMIARIALLDEYINHAFDYKENF